MSLDFTRLSVQRAKLAGVLRAVPEDICRGKVFVIHLRVKNFCDNIFLLN